MDGSDIVLPTGPRIIHKSDLFDVVIRDKTTTHGLTRTMYLLFVELVEQDPKVQRSAVVQVPEQTYNDVDVGEKVSARLYEMPDGSWTLNPPVIAP